MMVGGGIVHCGHCSVPTTPMQTSQRLSTWKMGVKVGGGGEKQPTGYQMGTKCTSDPLHTKEKM